MSIKHLINEIEKGLKLPALFLYAGDQYLLKEASRMIAGTIPEEERAFSLDVFDLDGVDETPAIPQILDILNTVSFMGRQRLVLIENVQKLGKKDLEPLENYFSNPSPSTVLILSHLGAPKAIFKDFIKMVKSISLDMRPEEFTFWIKEKARQNGLELTRDAMEFMLGIVGPDAGIISSEVEKLALIGKTRIDARDIAGIVTGCSEYGVFDLVNALRDRDRERVFMISRTLQETQESYGLLGAINWHYSRISARDPKRGVYYSKVFELLNEADIRIKTSGGTFPLEYLLIRLLEI